MIRINNKNNIDKTSKGFSLIEILISLAIFAVIATIGSSMFSTFANNQKRTKVSQELLNNAQYTLEIISREIKNNEIIVFGTSQCSSLDPIVYTKCLLFVRENGETAGFVYNNNNQELDYIQTNCARTDEGIYSNCAIASGQVPVPMLSETYNKSKIIDLQFILTPGANPYFDETGLNNQQPKVTILLAVRYPSTQLIEQVAHRLQTTVSSRVYKR